MNAEIVSVGTELLLGDIVNTNAQFLSKELAIAGINVYFQTSVGDNLERLKRVVVTALKRSDIVILTGGLGPTIDDITKNAVCEIINRTQVLHEESLNKIEMYYKRIGKPMPENTDRQAMLPQGCEVLPNDCGTAPGCIIKSAEKCIILLPGPPKEMQMMYSRYVVPFLNTHYASGVLCSKTIHIFGLGESQAELRCHDLMQMSNPTVAPYAKDGECYLRVTARGETTHNAQKILDPFVNEIMSRLDDNVYGVDKTGIEQTVVEELAKHEKTIATAESCTAGLLSKRLTDISGSSGVFDLGITAYSNNIKTDLLGVSQSLIDKHGAVSPQVAFAMARGVAKRANADIGVGITGLAGPEGATSAKPIGLVYVALHDGTNCWVRRLYLNNGTLENTREYIRHMATSHALNLVRQYLEVAPMTLKGANAIITIGAPDTSITYDLDEQKNVAAEVTTQPKAQKLGNTSKELDNLLSKKETVKDDMPKKEVDTNKVTQKPKKIFDIKLDAEPPLGKKINQKDDPKAEKEEISSISSKNARDKYTANCLTPEEIMGKPVEKKKNNPKNNKKDSEYNYTIDMDTNDITEDREDVFSDIPLNKFKKKKPI